jgi:hypothetical protein
LISEGEASREAQLAIKEKYPYPYHQGAFICQGNPDSLSDQLLESVKEKRTNFVYALVYIPFSAWKIVIKAFSSSVFDILYSSFNNALLIRGIDDMMI